ncbi:MAG TPA: helix-turn-helix transcriptional regulator [Gaiellaceae bacterium]|nr:helix-turn-helix transcriptional regulator [Gaiellaceae bacterium]
MASDRSPAAGETIGQRLKRLRLERGLSQRELAAPGVSYAYISRIEAGTRQPSVKALRKLAAKLGCTADFLETGSGLASSEARELQLADLELSVRLGEWDDLEAPLERLLAEAVGAGDTTAATRARVALAALAQEHGEYERSASLLEATIADEPFMPVEHFDIYTQLGRAYASAGRPKQAVELFERCMDGVEQVGETTLAARYATLLSYALTDIGDVARAETVVERALELVRDTADPYMRVRLYWSMARLAHKEGREAVALTNVRKAIALLEATDDSFHLARAHLLAARIMIAREDADSSELHLKQARKLFGVTPSIEDSAELKILLSRAAALRGDTERATHYARLALELQGLSLVDEAYATGALADALALSGDHEGAHSSYGHAAGVLEGQGLHREAARICHSWGHLLQKAGRDTDAAEVLDRATGLMLRATPAEAHAER